MHCHTSNQEQDLQHTRRKKTRVLRHSLDETTVFDLFVRGRTKGF